MNPRRSTTDTDHTGLFGRPHRSDRDPARAPTELRLLGSASADVIVWAASSGSTGMLLDLDG
ncbi:MULTISPECIES: hypothetical protein [Streptosporangium]|uniref:Uncharacterized protein n=1 Tax=Streptosporangium brasiliense TaxID=47480 RepID=A0ABT9R5I7_9ACTN|nr:hypothetical protein [Streptosporangium brasiliense]MDP9864507.1 hypothetical protein [Streptosporangium brasiliense]